MLFGIKNPSQSRYNSCYKKQSYIPVSNLITLQKDEFNFTGSTNKEKNAEKIAKKLLEDYKIHDRKMYAEIMRLINIGTDSYYIDLMLKTLSKKRFMELGYMLRNGLSLSYINDYIALDDNKASRMKELFDAGITSNFKTYINMENEEEYSAFKNLASSKAMKTYLKQNDIDSQDSMVHALLKDLQNISGNKKQCGKLLNILNNENIVKLEKGGHIDTYTLGAIIVLDNDNMFDYCAKLFSKDNFTIAAQKSRISDIDMSRIILNPNIVHDKVLKLFSDDSLKYMFERVALSMEDLEYISQFDDEIIKKISRVVKNTGVQKLMSSIKLKIRNMIELAELSDSEIDSIEKLLEINNDKMIRLMKQAGIINIIKYRDKINYEEFFKHIDNEYVTSMEKLQNDSGARLVAKKRINSEDNTIEDDRYGDDFRVKVLKIVSADDEGNISKSTTEIHWTLYTTWYQGAKRVLLLRYNDKNILSQMEIVNNDKDEPEYLIYSKQSDKLPGVYETTKYNLNDYPQDMNVIKAIQDGTIQGGEKISHVKTFDDGSIRYVENYNCSDTSTRRNYFQKTDNKGNIISYNYSYNITDRDNNSLLSLNRSWERNYDWMTTTTVNNETYRAIFDSSSLSVMIFQKDGDCRVFNIGNMVWGNSLNAKKKLFDFIKTVPADKITLLGSHISSLNIVKPLDSCIVAGDEIRLNTDLNLAIMSHELCHAAEFDGSEPSNVAGKISKNKELIDIYNKEMREFNREYPQSCQAVIKYFGQTGGSADTGLAEFVAETSMLLTTYGNNNEKIQSRAQYIVRYFPKTIAKIAQLLQEHMIF